MRTECGDAEDSGSGGQDKSGAVHPDAGMVARCPAMMIAAPSSGSGKTTITAALARLHARLGRRVRVFKAGPDFLDPLILERASGHPVRNLDLWMVGDAACARLLAEAAVQSDLILIEGVMGLYDGQPSSAALAQCFGLPVVSVINAGAMAQTFGAIAHGLRAYDSGLQHHGVFANRVAGASHEDMLRASVRAPVRWLGALHRDEQIHLPERQLGLVAAGEVPDLDARLDRAADAVAPTALADLPPPVTFSTVDVVAPAGRLLAGKRIAIARDAAFCFIYPANLDCLRELGADLVFFSPLADGYIPLCDALWLPGGYPELHAARLSGNANMRAAVRAFVESGRPVWAECGGLMALFQHLTDRDGVNWPMWSVLPGGARMQACVASLGLQDIDLGQGPLRGHTFHFSQLVTPLTPSTHARRHPHDATSPPGEAVFRAGAVSASYVHAYFPSNPWAVAALFGAGEGG